MRSRYFVRTTQKDWERVGSGLFQFQSKTYLLLVDYYSRYIEVALLDGLASAEVIRHIKSIFVRHGVPEMMVSDNEPQYACEEFKTFAPNTHSLTL